MESSLVDFGVIDVKDQAQQKKINQRILDR
jgi:hypothetical protein